MVITEKDIKKISLIAFLALLVILTYLIIKPVLFSVLAGLILAYIFLPVHKFLVRLVKSKPLSAVIVSLILLVIIVVPLWYLLPLISKQVFELFKISQELNLTPIIKTIFPTASEQFISQIDLAAKSGFSQVTSSIVSSTVNLLVNFVTISLHLLLTAFVFFFSLRDEDKLRNFASGLLPLGKNQEKQFVKQFKDITQSILYGQVVAGLIQGVLAAFALYIFGIPNAFILSIFAIVLSVIPVIGPGFVYVPVTIYMVINGNPLLAVGYFLFNVIIVSPIENVFRAHFVSRKTNLSQAIILIGMVGGLFLFNIIGLILGPLILAYLITFLKAYKENTLSTFFDSS